MNKHFATSQLPMLFGTTATFAFLCALAPASAQAEPLPSSVLAQQQNGASANQTICSPLKSRSGAPSLEPTLVGLSPTVRKFLDFTPVLGTPVCETSIQAGVLSHKCSCLDGQTVSGERDITADEAEMTPQERIQQCEQLLTETCGDQDESIQVECDNQQEDESFSDCQIFASRWHGSSNVHRVVQTCFCQDGRDWSTDQVSSLGLALSQEQLQDACKEQLKACDPSSELAPAQNEIVLPGQDHEKMDSVFCQANFEPEADETTSQCELYRLGDSVLFDCECGSKELPFAGVLPVSTSSNSELVGHCNRVIAQCNPAIHLPKVNKDPAPKSKGCEDEVKKAAKSLGCAVQRDKGPASLVFLCLTGALFRRRRIQ